MNRQMLFAAGIVVGLVCVVIAIVYWVGGTGLGHHIKHGILFFGIAVVAFLFAVANRPLSKTPAL
jgi:hypothetical protein